MQNYKIVCLKRNSYCDRFPGDTDCHYIEKVKANSKMKAVMKLHKEMEYNHIAGSKSKRERFNCSPMVWEVIHK